MTEEIPQCANPPWILQCGYDRGRDSNRSGC